MIVKTSLEDQEKQLQLKLKRLDIQERKYELGDGRKQKCKDESDRINIDKLVVLQFLVGTSMIDENRSLIGSEGVHKPVFTEEEMWILKGKILEIVKKL